MKKIRVQAANGNYDVLVGRGALGQLRRVVARVGENSAVFVISSPRVWRHWGARIEKILGASRRATILMDDAETAKNLSTVERACRDLVLAGADRRALIVAVGAASSATWPDLSRPATPAASDSSTSPRPSWRRWTARSAERLTVNLRKGRTWSARFIRRRPCWPTRNFSELFRARIPVRDLRGH